MATNKHALIRYKSLDRCFAKSSELLRIDSLLS